MIGNPRIGSVLRLDDYGTKRAIAEHNLGKPIARGTFSAIFNSPDPDKVYKLTVDPASYESMSGPFRLKGPFALRVFKNLGDIGEQIDGMVLYLTLVERLTPLESRREYKAWYDMNEELSGIVIDLYVTEKKNENVTISQRSSRSLEIYAEKMPESDLKDFIEQLARFVINLDAGFDFHPKNVMKRPSDGHHVVSDPVFDLRMQEELERASHKRFKRK